MAPRYIARIYFIVLFIISLFIPRIFNFMTLNIFLAYIPLELCFLLRLFKPTKSSEWPLFFIFGLIFILLVPNTFYMITDLIHLNLFKFNFLIELNLTEWFAFAYLLAGVFFAIYCMIFIFISLEHFTSNIWLNRCLVLSLMFLNGIGIYVGRFLRFHTVYLITRPLTIAHQVFDAINLKSVIFIMLMVLLQAIVILFVKGVRLIK
ncbi:DUF1361 domain-containing protein [Staphylococcus hominis]|uniref:DUF1361 domain-containing protein n=1 Tax=Staphylococcus hominis TaxID=1290 RepID=UPI002DC00ED7|nr:DUF1361 domain-containing protein [Staphylococcus hominis]MEB5792866.1 DUF1361 domain-containing protein [Staphylococcus hominis]